jgi:hypothetical protein
MLIKGEHYTGVLFVHIPKTAGTSIAFKLGKDQWKRQYPRGHDPYFYLKENNQIDESIFSFAVARNPYTRTYSCFRQFNRTHNKEIIFSEYLQNVRDNIVSDETPMLHLPQSFYVSDSKKVNTLNKIYRFENLKALEEDFGWTIGWENKSNYGESEYKDAYTEENIALVQYLYDQDFAMFRYSKEFMRGADE